MKDYNEAKSWLKSNRNTASRVRLLSYLSSTYALNDDQHLLYLINDAASRLENFTYNHSGAQKKTSTIYDKYRTQKLILKAWFHEKMIDKQISFNGVNIGTAINMKLSTVIAQKL